MESLLMVNLIIMIFAEMAIAEDMPMQPSPSPTLTDTVIPIVTTSPIIAAYLGYRATKK